MAENLKIEWTDATWNPITGCTKISPGCTNCYAERMSKRLAGRYGYPADEPFKPGIVHDKALYEPIKWKKPRKVFVCSMGDLFHEKVNFHDIDLIVSLVALLPQHQFLFLTKRPMRMKEYFAGERDEGITSGYIQEITRASGGRGDKQFRYFPGIWQRIEPPKTWQWPLPNLWLGVTVCNQAEADEKIPVLLDTPAAGRFVSVEPMLGPVDFRQWLVKDRFYTAKCPRCGWIGSSEHCGSSDYWSQDGCECPKCCTECDDFSDDRKLDWMICGGETGPDARPLHLDWVRSLRGQCQESDTPFFFKQWGEYGPTAENIQTGDSVFRMFDSESHWVNKASSWMRPGDVCIDAIGKICRNGGDFGKASYPVVIVRRVGKKNSGCLLDGKEFKEFPERLRK